MEIHSDLLNITILTNNSIITAFEKTLTLYKLGVNEELGKSLINYKFH